MPQGKSPVLIHNRMRITKGRAAEFKAAVQEAVSFVEANGPQLAVQVFVESGDDLAHSFQLHPDAASLARHVDMARSRIAEVMEHCTVERVQVYGGAADLEGVFAAAGAAEIVDAEWIAGFARENGRTARQEPQTSRAPARITVLGTGAIGSAVTESLLSAGHMVTVWNRNPARLEPLVAAGAEAASTPASAAEKSHLVLLCMTNYDAVQATLTAAGSGLNGRVVVVLTTGTAEEARATAALVKTWGATYIDAGVQTSPQDVGTDRAMFVFSGAESAFQQHESTLRTLGPTHFVGQDPGGAAVHDLAMFGLWYDAQLGLLRAYETLMGAGIDLREFAPLAAKQLGHVVASAAEAAAEIEGQEFPRGPASLAEHEPVMRDIASLRSGLRLGTGGIDSAAELVHKMVDAGLPDNGLTAILARDSG